MWLKQASEPLFAELEWNKPERRDQAGNVLIIGGNVHNLTAPATSYETVKKLGIGEVRVVLPSKTRALLPKSSWHEFIFLPSTSSGEFSIEGETELLENTMWADSILLPGDTGRNSQTSVLIENLLSAYKERVVISRDAVELLNNVPKVIIERENTTAVVSFAQLQKLIKNYGETKALVFSMDLTKLVEYLSIFSKKTSCDIVTFFNGQLVVASSGKVSTTKLTKDTRIQDTDQLHWRLNFANHACCYQTWYPNKSFQALTHSAYLLSKQN